MFNPRRALRVALTSLLPIALISSLVAAPASAASNSLLANTDFNSLAGWNAGTAVTKVTTVAGGRTGSAAKIAGSSTARLILTDKPNTDVSKLAVGTKLTASVWVKATTKNATISLALKEKNGTGTEVKNIVAIAAPTSWKQIKVPLKITKKNAYLDVSVRVDGLPVGQSVLVDDISLPAPSSSASTPKPSTPATDAVAGKLSNGCTYTTRGIPSCGAYVGGTYNSNTDPKAWESTLTKQIGVRRVFYNGSQIDKAVATAQADAAAKRVTWMSFKTPYSWKEMANGKGDAWARELGQKLAKVDGPVWVAIWHEPENDSGDIKDWTAMQARLAPIIRDSGDNIAYTIILMGYHQFYGDSKYSLDSIWPKNTKVDIAGFDIYDEYGMTKKGTVTTKHKEFRTNYFEKIQAWAEPKGIAWGLAETGFSEASVKNTPTIMSNTYNDLLSTGGIAFAYFNTHLNSSLDWRLNTTARKNAFNAIHKDSATIR